MFSDLPFTQLISLIIVVVAFGFYISRIDQRVKMINNRLGRLSLTFLKIENDLAAIQDSLILMSRSDEKVGPQVAKLRDRKTQSFMDIVSDGPNRQEIMRGLEPPDIDDDPTFWAEDRMKRFGFETTSDLDDEK